MTPEPDPTIEASLAAHSGLPASDWERIRSELARRAEADGLADVSVEPHDTPLGRMLVAATSVGLVRVALPGADDDDVLQELSDRVSRRVLWGTRATLTQVRHELEEYFDGTRHDFEVPLDWQLTRGFRREVLRATAEIPYGSTSSYRDVATRAGSPRAVRAAGSALARNPLPIVVPCHRVLRTGGALGSYGGGVAAKAALLALEGFPLPGRARGVASSGSPLDSERCLG